MLTVGGDRTMVDLEVLDAAPACVGESATSVARSGEPKHDAGGVDRPDPDPVSSFRKLSSRLRTG